MIGRIHGILLEKQAPYLLVDVGGVGYELMAPMSTFYLLPETGKPVTLLTHLIVREDAQTLYAFKLSRERELFRALIKTSGVGARLALGILSGVDPDTFAQCIIEGDITTLVKLPGIGRKTAERLLIEMRDRLKNWQLEQSASNTFNIGSSITKDAISALMALGYRPNEASRAVAKYKDQDLASEELIRLALKDMAK